LGERDGVRGPFSLHRFMGRAGVRGSFSVFPLHSMFPRFMESLDISDFANR
jgi:hypothetical protein